MHELGVAFYVVKDVKQVAEENQVSKVISVTVQVGEVTGVIPDYLIDVWNWAKKKEPIVADAELKVEIIPAVTYCEGCQKEYPTVANGKICPYCGSDRTYLVRGSEFLIQDITVEDSASEDSAGEDSAGQDPASQDQI